MKTVFMVLLVGVFALFPVKQTSAALPLWMSSPEENWYATPPLRIHQQGTNQPVGFSPNQIRHAYGFDQLSQTGQGQIIGIVDAYDNTNAAEDLEAFSRTFNLPLPYGLPSTPPCSISAGPHPCFQKVYASSKPASNSGWALESALDIEWAHAMAQGADILLVEAKTSSLGNLLKAVDKATAHGAQVVSLSWGGPEFPSETHYDSHFNHAGVSFTVSSGDSGNGTSYPAVSSHVLAVGGTTLPLSNSGNPLASESAWSGSGGGISLHEVQPSAQQGRISTRKRSIPDLAYNANPSTGYAVYHSTTNQPNWWKLGGTSAGAPQVAALLSLANQHRTSPLSTRSLAPFYSAALTSNYSNNYHDIITGSNGNCGSACSAHAGFDLVTGLGSPRANNLIPFLSNY